MDWINACYTDESHLTDCSDWSVPSVWIFHLVIYRELKIVYYRSLFYSYCFKYCAWMEHLFASVMNLSHAVKKMFQNFWRCVDCVRDWFWHQVILHCLNLIKMETLVPMLSNLIWRLWVYGQSKLMTMEEWRLHRSSITLTF